MGTNGSLNLASKKGFDGRLAHYALAAGALLALPAAAHAGIVYSGPVNFTVTDANDPYGIDFDGNSVTDLTLNVQGPPSTKWVYLGGPSTTRVSTGPLSAGFAITAANTTSFLNQDLFKGASGPWLSTTHGYVGVKFNIGAQQNLGWAELTLDKNTPTVTLNSYAYETVAGAPIAAGAVPEPSSLALFAAGAAGILALRKRRNRAA